MHAEWWRGVYVVGTDPERCDLQARRARALPAVRMDPGREPRALHGALGARRLRGGAGGRGATPGVVKIAALNWMQVERYLERDDRAVVPLGSTEQHAYLSLATD